MNSSSLSILLLINVQSDEAPAIRAIHECRQWPKWILQDAPDIKVELGITTEILQYYDMQNRQWITCSLSFPHHVKRDGRLLLHRLGVACINLLEYVEQSKAKPMHF